jgi:hypothetical protein
LKARKLFPELDALLLELFTKTDRLLKMGSVEFCDPIEIDKNFCHVGQARAPRRTAKEDAESEVNLGLAEWFRANGFPEFVQYTWPSRSADSCKVSLALSARQSERRERPANLDEVIDRAVRMGDRVTAPRFMSELRPPETSEVWNAALGLSDESNAGFPYCMGGRYKMQAFFEDFGFNAEVVKLRVAVLQRAHPSLLELFSPVELVCCGFVDPFYTVEKWEPVKQEKLERQRNIVCGSMNDEVVDRLADGPINKDNILEWGECPSMIGVGFDRVSVERVYRSISLLVEEVGGEPIVDNDTTNYEFCLQDWLMDADARRRSLTYGFERGSRQEWFWRNRSLLKTRKVYVFSDGEMWAQRHWGYQPSGQYNTSSTNTWTRVMAALVIGAKSARAAGDDCVEHYVEDAVRKYWELCGMKIKVYKPASAESFEFCSQQWDGGEPVPLNAVKAFYRLACLGPTVDKYSQVISQFRLARETRRFVNLCERAGWPLGQSKVLV